jgi:death-on-curing protein
MNNWIWLDESILLTVHEEQLVAYGGTPGVRDGVAFESVVALPYHLSVFEEPDVATLAAAYAYGVEIGRPFADGNNVTACIVLELFLRLNGWDLIADDAALARTMLCVGAGDIDEATLASWIREHSAPHIGKRRTAVRHSVVA